MMVSTKGRYALMVCLDLARQEPGSFISLREVAQRQGMSMKYLESIVAMLNKAGLVQSQRGKDGGYRLAQPPEQCFVAEILQVTEGSLASVNCVEPAAPAPKPAAALPTPCGASWIS